MGRLIKAILFTVFIIPGAGHFGLGQKKRGAVFMAVVIAVLVIFLFHVMFLINRQIHQSPPVVQDAFELMNYSAKMSQQVMLDYVGVIKAYLYVLLVCYAAAIADLVVIFRQNKPNQT